ncbi:hypothetical protein IWW38_003861 [Coemansia aciculifera]|uniref:Uncharacterized protein n=1 Tax=Coemansia aciculifera TaxID=417176 RepID=A0ACC1M0Z9_9FUNG|nr:hypothetical protein IWW38_003861 [Coemansia aciculifera]
MRIDKITAILLLSTFSLAWDLREKFDVYSKILMLADKKTGSIEEHILYGKLAVCLDDNRTASKLSNTLESPQFRDGLLSLITTVNMARSEAIADPDGVGSLDYLVGRIRKTYVESSKLYFGR